jgi:sensor histidine kinase YesM
MLLLFLLTWVNLQASRGILDRQSRSDAAGTTEKTNQYLDLYVENIKSLLRYLQTEQRITSDRLRDLADMVPVIVETLYLIRDDGTVLCSRQVIYDLLGNDFRSSGYDPLSAGAVLSWSEPYSSNLSGPTVGLFQRISAGVVVVEIDLELLREQVAGAAGRPDMALVITSPDGRLILDDRQSPISYAVVRDTSFLRAVASAPYGSSVLAWEGRSSLLFKSRGNALGWNVHAIVDATYLESELGVLYGNLTKVGALLFGVLFVSSLLMSLIITRPVRSLAMSMDRVQSLNHLVPIPNNYTDELADLVDSYNAMMARINALSYENNEYEWRMLQSQIGPHFLYNTLACISALTKRNRVERVRRAIDSLVRLLRYSFDRQSSEVTLQDEIEMTEAYIRIQNIRYGDRFALDLHVPDDIRTAKVPALLLQPIVENSVFYGFSSNERTGRISLTARRASDELLVFIADDGSGMSADKLASVRARVEAQHLGCVRDPAGSERTDRNRLNAIGLHNIHRRLKVHYGGDYGLGIDSRPGVGTQVILRLPLLDR